MLGKIKDTDKSTGLVNHFVTRIKLSPGHEYEQAFLRLIIGLSVFVYTVYLNFDQPEIILSVSSLIILYTSAGIFLLIWIYKAPVTTPLRYIISSLIDVSGLSYVMFLGDGLGAALYPLFLWVIFGFGFRFGRPYLNLLMIESIIGFVIVYYNSAYWQEHAVLFYGLLFGLVILPLYISVLLKHLEQNIEEAKIANQAKSQFLSNMSHELRTPLNGIIGSNDLLKDSSLTKKQKKYVETIEYSVITLLDLIENILDLSKIESGKKEVLNEAFDLHHVLNTTVEMLRPHANKKGLSLKLEIDPQVPFLLIGDSALTRQILVNLIGNAIKYTDKGCVTLRISLRNIKKTACRIYFEIIDTGIGIEEDKLHFIFDRFTQVDTSDTRVFEGAGLGTAIAKEVVRCLNGEIGVESEYGGGSTFWFEIPYKLESMNYENNHLLNDMGVILVHDEKNTELQNKLKNWGVRLFVVSTAEVKLIEEIAGQKQPIHAIINDNCLNAVSNKFFNEEIKKSEDLKDVTTIMVSDDDIYNADHYYDFVLSSSANKTQLFNALHSVNYSFETDVEINRTDKVVDSKNFKILLAEDDSSNQDLFEIMLNNGGHSTSIANNGREALEQLSENKYDICIIDMQMPVMGGLEAVICYKEENPTSKMPFIMLTANATTEAIEKCKNAGVNLFLTKPIRSSDLLKAVNSMNS